MLYCKNNKKYDYLFFIRSWVFLRIFKIFMKIKIFLKKFILKKSKIKVCSILIVKLQDEILFKAVLQPSFQPFSQ